MIVVKVAPTQTKRCSCSSGLVCGNTQLLSWWESESVSGHDFASRAEELEIKRSVCNSIMCSKAHSIASAGRWLVDDTACSSPLGAVVSGQTEVISQQQEAVMMS